MAIALRTPGEIDAIAEAGRVAVKQVELAYSDIRLGETTLEIVERLGERLRDSPADSAIQGFRRDGRSYPYAACVSVNEQLPSAVASGRRIEPGDLVKIDLAVCVDGWHADAATTRVVGGGDSLRKVRTQHATQCLLGAISVDFASGVEWTGAGLQRIGEELGFGIAPGAIGHGVGRRLHESPALEFGRSVRLVPGMVLAVEPLLSAGPWPGEVPQGDGWTSVAADGSDVWVEERTVAITRDGPQLLTRFQDDRANGF
ncbi:MAG: methionyl aminopeptidase [Planctomycetota bacterium]